MNHLQALALGVAISILSGFSAFAASPEAGRWPTRWQVNGNGVNGTLEFNLDERGTLTGRLLDAPVEGFASGRHLFIRRNADGQVEVWEGWLAETPAPDTPEQPGAGNFIVAGSISITEDGETRVYPWFGTSEARLSAEPSTSPEATASAPATIAPKKPSGGPLTGRWAAGTDERMEILQKGAELTVTLPDGSSRAGRMTGATTLVVGLRKGCCNGKLDTPDVIVWSDGARWERAD